ncbi:MAG: NAD+ synthase [Pseudomonadota bacterium]
MNAIQIMIAQLNPVVGDLEKNTDLAHTAYSEAIAQSADLLVFTELFLTGYPPEDLILKPAFIAATTQKLETLARLTSNQKTAILMGTPIEKNGSVYNAVALLENGEISAIRHKVELPNYGVFDEQRVFTKGNMPEPIVFQGIQLGVPICEDIWFPNVCQHLKEKGAELLIVLNGSPFALEKHGHRMDMVRSRVQETGLPLIYTNQVGGQDELVFDGASFVLNANSGICVQLPAWEEDIVLTQWHKTNEFWKCETVKRVELENTTEASYLACVTGLRDYVEKSGFPGVVLGLSGGIDSALCAAIAVDALGAERVTCVMLPYKYTSSESLSDAAKCAENLGVTYHIVPIEQPVESALQGLKDLFTGKAEDVTEENIQSRMRGMLLMAISNKFGSMVITTGNKSEVAVGYATLYGDMNGGFNPIKDLYKTQVYELAHFRNTKTPKGVLGPEGHVIPENIITKAPTAELREGQKDQDSLPPYEVLDDILKSLNEEEMPIENIVAKGHDIETVQKVARLLYLAEYKRRQAALGVKISMRNFGRDRRYPIINKFRE